MASMTEITCACGCGRKKMVRLADVNRGWGKYYSKSCKATEQTRRMGRPMQIKKNREMTDEEIYEYAEMESGMDYLSECGDK